MTHRRVRQRCPASEAPPSHPPSTVGVVGSGESDRRVPVRRARHKRWKSSKPESPAYSPSGQSGYTVSRVSGHGQREQGEQGRILTQYQQGHRGVFGLARRCAGPAGAIPASHRGVGTPPESGGTALMGKGVGCSRCIRGGRLGAGTGRTARGESLEGPPVDSRSEGATCQGGGAETAAIGSSEGKS